MSRLFWKAFGPVAAGVVGGLWWLIGYMARFPQPGAVALGVAAFVAAAAFMRWFMAKAERPASGDDGSGERPVWSALDMNRLSPYSAWAHGASILPDGDATQEMPRPRLDDQTHIMRADEVFGRQGRHQAGVR